MNGYSGKALIIDLSADTQEVLHLDDDTLLTYLGGRGLCAWLLDKFLEKDPVIFACSPFTGTNIPSSGLCSVMHVSPMTGGLFRSDFGGGFAAGIKSSGFDAIVLTGKKKEPSHIQLFKGVLSSAIVPGSAAAEGFLHAGIICDDFYTPHRGTTGYALFTRNILSLKINYDASPVIYTDTQDIDRLINASPSLTGRLGIGRFGTVALYDLSYSRDLLPHKWFGREPEELSNACALNRINNCESRTCTPCPIGCKRASEGVMLPDYDEFSMLLAAGVPFKNLPEIYAECFYKGYDVITLCHCIRLMKDVSAVEVIKNAGKYPLLKKGSYALDPENSLTVKKLEIPAFDPAGAMGVALGYASSTNGADWKSTMAITHEILRKPVATDRFSLQGKAWLNFMSENAKAACDSLCLCSYPLFSVSAEEYALPLSFITKERFTAGRLIDCGNSIWNKEISILRRLGICHKEDMIPEFFYDIIVMSDFIEELKRYHHLRGEI